MLFKDQSLDFARPYCLSKDDVIAIVAPAGPFVHEKLFAGVNKLNSLGFQVVYSDCILEKKGYFAGEDNCRKSDLLRVLNEDSVQAVICARGGYGSLRILLEEIKDQIPKFPKIFVGFSDNTALLTYLAGYCGWVCFHGPMVATEQFINLPESDLLWCLKLLTKPEPPGFAPIHGAKTLRPGKAIGPLFGGNLTMLTHMAAASSLRIPEGAILFFEDINEPAYRIDRMLTALRWVFKKASCIMVGDLIGLNTEDITRLLIDCLPENLPIIYDAPFGHGSRNVALPLGVKASLNADDCSLELLEAAVCFKNV